MKYAVIRLNGQQFKVEEGQEILVNFLNGAEPKPEVLLVKTDKSTKVGTPLVDKNPVKLSVVAEEEKGTKIHVSKYKAKSRYRKHIGFRPKFTRVKVEKIG